MVETYMTQLERQAAAAGVTVKDAANAEGIHASTVWRWQNEGAAIGEETAKRIAERIAKMAANPPKRVRKAG